MEVRASHGDSFGQEESCTQGQPRAASSRTWATFAASPPAGAWLSAGAAPAPAPAPAPVDPDCAAAVGEAALRVLWGLPAGASFAARSPSTTPFSLALIALRTDHACQPRRVGMGEKYHALGGTYKRLNKARRPSTSATSAAIIISAPTTSTRSDTDLALILSRVPRGIATVSIASRGRRTTDVAIWPELTWSRSCPSTGPACQLEPPRTDPALSQTARTRWLSPAAARQPGRHRTPL